MPLLIFPWKILLLLAALPLLDCAAARKAAASRSSTRPRRATAAGNRPAPAARRRASSDFGDWSSGGGSSEEGGDNDEWDSYDEDDDLFNEDEFGYPAVGTDAGRRTRQPSSDDLGYDTGSYDYSQGEHEDGGWSSEGGDEHSWEDNYDDDDVLASPKGRNSRAPSRRQPRPSAWTGDGAGGSGRRRSGARGSSRYQRGRRPAAPTTRGFAVRMPAVSGAAIASALRQKMGTAAEAVGQAGSLAASTSQKLKREVKLVVSGSWESALLKVTWPDDLPPDETLVLSMVDAVKTFKKDRDVTKNSAEHRVLLRKLWAKMSEPDWRTVSKAVYLFHSILRDLPVEHHAILKIFLAKMSREWDKKTACRYFDLDVLCRVSEEGEAFRSFVDRYGTYVFKRAEGFNARFQELDTMQREEGWENVVTTLAKAQKAIDLGVSCQPQPEEETELTVLCLRNTALDLHQLWRRFHSSLDWVLEEAEDGDLFDGADSAMVEECLNDFKGFYMTRYDDVLTFLLDAEELLGIYGLHVPDLSLPAAHGFDTPSTQTSTDSNSAVEEAEEVEEGSSGSSGNEDGGSESSEESTAVETAVEAASAAARPRKATTAPATSSKTAASRAKAYRASKTASSRGSPSVSYGGGGGSSNPSDVASKGGNDTVKNAAVKGGGARRGVDRKQSAVPPGVERTESVGEKGGVDEAGPANREAGGGESESEEDSSSEEYDDDSSSSSEEEDDDDETDDEEEDSAEEGAVDEHVDDLTYFDDATQPDRSSGSDDEWDR
ncbi:weakly similar Glutamic acid-rich protein precursor [Ectocarpus siliculosus]|uniref:Weakly similar Glutamic acid-rich protein n=1 Tax=Ectocarpus siliculosus TaxID=2880 RepID=D7G759_ECTSI|nr:weakly similar Glutamic acid-rich protein precursor [Ectocarpus siliculosus]|eukprot:CBJ25752.1 weakly similar Glutamic acid-rich protein precursor [Ectocarpus siliculosus]